MLIGIVGILTLTHKLSSLTLLEIHLKLSQEEEYILLLIY